MPRGIDLIPPSQRKVPNDPTQRIQFDLRRWLAQYPFSAEALEQAIIDAIEDFLRKFQMVTNIDLRGLAEAFYLAFGSLDFSSPEAFLASLAQALLNLGTFLLGPNSPLNALNLFNLVPTDLLGQISVSNIGTAITNLITDPNFLDTGVIPGWLHSLTGGFGGTGMRSVVADGSTKELLGNLIPVSAGQTVPLSVKSLWTNLIGTGSPIALAITGYTNTGAVVQQTLASRSVTANSGGWVDLVGSYLVPENVVSLRPRLVVGSTATAGTVSFSKASATKVGSLLQRLIAGTDPGKLLPDDIANLFTGIVSNATGLLSKVELTQHNNLLAALGGTTSQIQTRINSFLSGSSPLNADNINAGNLADQFVAGITTINDNIVTKLLGLTGSGFGHTDAARAFESNTHALVDVSARLSQLETTFTGGLSDGDDFERKSTTSLGSGWITITSGGAGIWATPDGHDASFAASGFTDRDFVCIRNAGVIRSSTDLQRVGLVMSSAASEFFGFCGHNDIWLRISDATTSFANITGIRIRFGGDGSVSIDRFVNGARVTLNELPPDSITPPGPGAMIIGEGGLPGTARYFRALVGTSTRLEIPEVGVASGLGSAFRRWGHGGRAEGHLLPLPGQERPGSAHQWFGMDQVAA